MLFKRLLLIATLVVFTTGCEMIETKAEAKKGTRQVDFSAWVVYWDGGLSLKSYEENAHLIARICPEYYHVREDGMPYRVPTLTRTMRDKTTAIAKKNGTKILALMGNYNNKIGNHDAKLVQKFFYDESLYKKHIEKLISMAKTDSVDGLDIDYENMEAKDRGAYTKFVVDLAKRCREEGLLVGIAVHPKMSEPGGWGAPQAQNWEKIGEVVDFFRPMCYDFHWGTSEAGPLAPPKWVEKIIRFAAKKVSPEKIEIGVPAYGYDWRGKKARSIVWPEWQELVKKHGNGRRDRETQELVLEYDGREVWFCDARAMSPTYKLVKELGLAGVTMWRLGGEDPDMWRLYKAQRFY